MPTPAWPQQLAVDFDEELQAFIEECASGMLKDVPFMPLDAQSRRLLAAAPTLIGGMARQSGLPPLPGRSGRPALRRELQGEGSILAECTVSAGMPSDSSSIWARKGGARQGATDFHARTLLAVRLQQPTLVDHAASQAPKSPLGISGSLAMAFDNLVGQSEGTGIEERPQQLDSPAAGEAVPSNPCGQGGPGALYVVGNGNQQLLQQPASTAAGDTASSSLWGMQMPEACMQGVCVGLGAQKPPPLIPGVPEDFLQLALRAAAESAARQGANGQEQGPLPIFAKEGYQQEIALPAEGFWQGASGMEHGPLPMFAEGDYEQAAVMPAGGYGQAVGIQQQSLQQIFAEGGYQQAAVTPAGGLGQTPEGAEQSPPALLKKKVRKKARILKDGQLTLIVFGKEEAFKWERRVASFLNAVRDVLGDRALVQGQWQGSILDSVVGAFLTQNVTDALSSKAYMTLAARFPAALPPPAQGNDLAPNPAEPVQSQAAVNDGVVLHDSVAASSAVPSQSRESAKHESLLASAQRNSVASKAEAAVQNQVLLRDDILAPGAQSQRKVLETMASGAQGPGRVPEAEGILGAIEEVSLAIGGCHQQDGFRAEGSAAHESIADNLADNLDVGQCHNQGGSTTEGCAASTPMGGCAALRQMKDCAAPRPKGGNSDEGNSRHLRQSPKQAANDIGVMGGRSDEDSVRQGPKRAAEDVASTEAPVKRPCRTKLPAACISGSEDSVDWEAVRSAAPEQLADAIRCRGMYNFLVIRIQGMLNRIRREGPGLAPPLGDSVSLLAAELDARAMNPPHTPLVIRGQPGKPGADDATLASVALKLIVQEQVSLAPSKPAVMLAEAPDAPHAAMLPAEQLEIEGEPQKATVGDEAAGPTVVATPEQALFTSHEDSHPGTAVQMQMEEKPGNVQQPGGLLELLAAVAADTAMPAVEESATVAADVTIPRRDGCESGCVEYDLTLQQASSLRAAMSQAMPSSLQQDDPASLAAASSADSPLAAALDAADAAMHLSDDQNAPLTQEAYLLAEREINAPLQQHGLLQQCSPIQQPEQQKKFDRAAHNSLPDDIRVGALSTKSAQRADVPVDRVPTAASKGRECEDMESVELSDDEADQDPGARQEGGFPLDLEWLRGEDVEDARSYLMGVEGLGRKSVACILLLALGMKDFPVDTNVGRICARLGWIPLDAENLLEDLDDYAPEPEVHKYLHSRLMKFSIPVLYELHYHMITLGKVFCSKRDPNCSACPLQDQCEYALNNGRRRKHADAAKGGAITAVNPPPCAQNAPTTANKGVSFNADAVAPAVEEMAQGGAAVGTVESDSAAVGASAGDIEDLCGLPPSATTIMQAAVGREPEAELARILEAGALLNASLALRDRLEADGMAEEASSIFARLLSEAAWVMDLGNDYILSDAAPLDLSSLPTSYAAGVSDKVGSKPLLTAGVERKRFLELSVLMHPDKNPHPLAEQAFGVVKRAHGVLVDHFASLRRAKSAGNSNAVGKAEENVAEIPSNISRLVIEAWEVPLSARHMLPQGITAYHSAADFPFLLIRVPPAANAAVMPQIGSPSFSTTTSAKRSTQPAGSPVRSLGSSESAALCSPASLSQGGPVIGTEAAISGGSFQAAAASDISQLPQQEIGGPCPAPAAQKEGSSLSCSTQAFSMDGIAPGSKEAQVPAEQATAQQISEASQTPSKEASTSRPSSQPAPFCAKAAAAASREGPLQPRMQPAALSADVATANGKASELPETQPRALCEQAPKVASVENSIPTQPAGLCTVLARRLMGLGSAILGGKSADTARCTLQQLSGVRMGEGQEGRDEAESSATVGGHGSPEGAQPPSCGYSISHEPCTRLESAAMGLHASKVRGPGIDCDAEERAQRGAGYWAGVQGVPDMARTTEETAAPDVENIAEEGRPHSGIAQDVGIGAIGAIGAAAAMLDSTPAEQLRTPVAQAGACFQEGTQSAPAEQPGRAAVEDGRARVLEGAQAEAERPAFALLVPCRVAMKGRFPLNGTYFQTNELFLDLESSRQAKFEVDEVQMASWRRRIVLCGSSVGSICRGMTQRQVSRLFKDGFMCVRAYEPASGMPQQLPGWLQPGGAKPPATPRRRKADSLASPSSQYSRSQKRTLSASLLPPLAAGEWGLLSAQTPKRRGRPPNALVAARRALLGSAGSASKLLFAGTQGMAADKDALWVPERYKAKQAKEGGAGRQRVQVLPKIPSSARCGHCKSCINRSMKKACFTRRAEMLAAMEMEGVAVGT